MILQVHVSLSFYSFLLLFRNSEMSLALSSGANLTLNDNWAPLAEDVINYYMRFM